MRQLENRVVVSVNQTGEPVRFVWKENRYLVIAKPRRWFTRKNWWLTSTTVQPGTGQAALEAEVWAIKAKPADTEEPCQEFELSRDNEGNFWSIKAK